MDENAENRVLFFAKVLRTATDDEVRELFSQFGRVHEVNLFRAFQGAPTTKGCGLVTMGTHEEATTAIDVLDSKYTWPGMDSTMVVKWMDVAMQRRRREQHLAAVRQGLVPNLQGTDWRGALFPGGYMLANGPGLAAPSSIPAHDTENPPVGCDPDTIKLFVGNLPRSCTEQQLLQLCETIGKVVELVIVRDKATQEPKGSAFVWYATRACAERAILQFNLRHCLPDPTGEQDRPLVVRKAKARTTALHPSVLGADSVAQQLMDLSANAANMQPMQAQAQAPFGVNFNTMMHGMMNQGMMDTMGLPSGTSGLAIGRGPPLSRVANMPYQTAQLAGMLGFDPATAPDAGLFGMNHGGPGAVVGTDSYSRAGNPRVDNLQHVAMTMPINQQQMSIVNSYLFSIQTMSGAQLSMTPGVPGLFHMVLSGSVAQVENAQNLLSSLLNNGS